MQSSTIVSMSTVSFSVNRKHREAPEIGARKTKAGEGSARSSKRGIKREGGREREGEREHAREGGNQIMFFGGQQLIFININL